MNGKLNNLQDELQMSGAEYSTCVSIFFVGQARIIRLPKFAPDANL